MKEVKEGRKAPVCFEHILKDRSSDDALHINFNCVLNFALPVISAAIPVFLGGQKNWGHFRWAGSGLV
jgi:hypothetical protein